MSVNVWMSFLFSCSKNGNIIQISCPICLSLSNPGLEKSFAVVDFLLFLVAVNGDNTAAAVPLTMTAADQEEVNSACVQKGGVGNTKDCSNPEGYDVPEQHGT